MVCRRVLGVRSMSNGRGPLVGKVHLSDVGAMRIIVGRDRMARILGDAPYVVVVERTEPSVAWSKQFNCPIQAETVGRMIECLGAVQESQLEAMGFVEGRRDLGGN